MLRHTLIHPEITAVLAAAGHHGRVLIADGNYPASTTLGPHAELVSLNLSPGVVTVPQVLAAVLSAVPIEAANVMGIPPDDPYATDEPPAWAEYRRIFRDHGLDIEPAPIDKWDFYETVRGPDHVLTIQTADQALWANLLLSIGVRQD